jgi:hypothetical protein
MHFLNGAFAGPQKMNAKFGKTLDQETLRRDSTIICYYL